jgi:hypothetical protein
MTAALASDICHWGTYALVMAYIVLGAICEWRQWVRPRLFKVLGVALFFALFAIDILRSAGLQELVLSACLNIVWSLLGYRALRHEKTAERIQMGVIAVLPLVCVAFAMPAIALIIFLIAYFAVLFVYLGRLALAEPTTGSVAYSERMLKARHLSMPGRRFWIKTSLLGLLAFAVGGLLFLVVPRWGNDAVSAMPAVQPSRSGFPDVALDKTGTIELDSTLMFRVALPETSEPRYWRIEAQNIFDGKKWRAIGGQRDLRQKTETSETVYRLEFVKEWRDHRIPTLYGTTTVVKLSENQNARIQFYPDAADVWHRWGWRRENPLMGFEFQLQDTSNTLQFGKKLKSTMTRYLKKLNTNQEKNELSLNHESKEGIAQNSIKDLDENVAFYERHQGKWRLYYQISAEPGKQPLSIGARTYDKRPAHIVAWHLITRLNRDLKPLHQQGKRFEYDYAPMFHQDTTLFDARRIWPGRKKGSASVQRIQKFAKSIVGDAQTHEEKAIRVRDYLHTHYQYSLKRPERREPIIEDFLFDQKFGHCEMFSTSMAVLLASIDVPVRNVSGFASNEYRDGMHHVRAAHAHSWVEVFLDESRGWTVFEATPPGSSNVKVDWLVRIDDWFTSYEPRDLYAWMQKYGLIVLAVLLLCIGFIKLVRVPMQYVRRCLQPTRDVWQWAWNDLMMQCQKDPQTQILAERSLEAWWEQGENDEITAFAKAYIAARYQKKHIENEQYTWRQRFCLNRQILCRKNKIMRALKAKKRA